MMELLDILKKDFEELTSREIQVLRNEFRKRMGVEGKIDTKLIFNFYLILKRKYVPKLEQLFISNKSSSVNGVFSKKCTQVKVPVPTFDGLNRDQTGIFYIDDNITLPVLTVSYLEDKTEVVCLSPTGNFCILDDNNFVFNI